VSTIHRLCSSDRFASNSATPSPQDLFEDLASDEDEESPKQLSRCHPSKPASATLPSITPTQFSLDIDDRVDELDAEAFESPSKRQRTAQSPGSSALPFSQSSLPSVHTTPSICRIGDIPQRYYDMEDDDSDFVEEVEDDIFEINAHIQTERTVNPSKMAANRKAIIHNHVMGWGRANVLSQQPPISTGDESFRKFERSFSQQIHNRFKEIRQSTADLAGESNTSPRTRSSIASLDACDDDLEDLDTFQEPMSRLMFEDIIKTKSRDALQLYVSKATIHNISGWWGDTFLRVLEPLQLSMIRMHSRDFYIFDVHISGDTNHHLDIVAGNTSLPLLKKRFNENDGFSISFDGVENPEGTPFTLTNIWYQRFIFNAYDLLFFEPHRDCSRLFYSIFHTKNLDAIRQLFKVLSSETVGDYALSYSLYAAYLSRLLKRTSHSLQTLQENPENVFSFDNDQPASNAFFTAFDNHCKNCLDGIVDGWNNYSKPVIALDKFHEWMDHCERTFPALWAHMTNLRGVYGGKRRKKKDIKTVQARQRRVFMSLLSFKRMQNPKSLTHWALILSISYKSMGVGATALDITNYFGIVVSSTKRDAYIKKLYAGIQARQTTELLSKENFIIYVMDNFQRGQRLKKQRGGHSSSFLSSTNQFAQLPRMFDQSQYKGFKPITELSFDMKQPIISPFGMPAYEDKISMDDATFFNKHYSFLSAPEIDTSGARVKAYTDRGDVCEQILAISLVVGTITDVRAGEFICAERRLD
jgi:hypothetical protein